MMKLTINEFSRLISAGDWDTLFIDKFHWNRVRGNNKLQPITVQDAEYEFCNIAHRSGFKVQYCEAEEIPSRSEQRQIDSALRRQGEEYLAIIRKKGTAHDLWMIPVRNNGKRELVFVEYDNGNASVIWDKREALYFEVTEDLRFTDMVQRMHSAFIVNSEKVTKNFYAGFKKQHKQFAELISGIDDHISFKENKNKQWYASVMLNRLMFCYFIQKKGFLDNKVNYLKEKLKFVRENEGPDKFFNFYRSFLCRLFHDGLNATEHSREFEEVFGRIPYLNGGMFDRHQIESDYSEIDIKDEAFISLFDFFDEWEWHLDTRLTASGKDINPDVLGYIFEQYINDRAQMGAYYTKEDITEYIGRNCILPFLFDQVKSATKDSAKEFEPDGYVWCTLRESGDRYIFDAVKKGHEEYDEIPENISRGIITETMHKEYAETPVGELPESHISLATLRSDWNTRTPEKWGLPNEIWRETIERIQRCDDILNKINRGEITSINDFITYNLDIRSFASDLIAKGDSRFVGWFYHALQKVTVLDPTCGSGAFLFAAMNILEPLYEICIERMQDFNRENPVKFKEELAEITDKYRSNIQYFIFKSIILRNLYGVDIMVEATEIAKLRLFLKMVAVVDVERRLPNLGLDPLPDIDFNIRCGNTLVGYANKEQLDKDLAFAKDIFEMEANEKFKEEIKSDMEKVAAAYRIFVYQQLRQEEDMAAFKQAKHDLRRLLKSLNDKLNHRLYSASSPDISYDEWLKSHQPFNWLAEFYQIIEGNHGFDVIIGNPPYVTFTDKSLSYKVNTYYTYSTKNLFALCAERCTQLSCSSGSIGYIIPLSGMSIDAFEPLQKIIYNNCLSWNSYYSGDRNPAELFSGVKIRAGIYISRNGNGNNKKYTSKYIKFQSAERPSLFSKLQFIEYTKEISAPKIPSSLGLSVIDKVNNLTDKLNDKFGIGDIVYYHAAPIHWGKCISNLSKLKDNNLNIADSYKKLDINEEYRDFTFILLNSTLFFYYWIAYSDCYNLTKKYFNIHIPIVEKISFKKLAKKLNFELFDKMQIAEYNYKNRGNVRFAQFFPKQSKSVIDEIDTVLARHYGFTDEELDFIINYDIKYRMGDELNNSGAE